MSPAADSPLRRWVAQSVGGANAVVVSESRLRPDAPRWLVEVSNGDTATKVILKSGDHGMRDELATEAAALTVAEAHRLRTPRLIAADLDGNETGRPAILITFVDGTDQIPSSATPQRLRALGAAAAESHAVPLEPTPELPLRSRHMPWIDFSAGRLAGTSPTTPLLERGDRAIRQLPAPDVDTVFVHGDLWTGNTLWRDGEHVATIDWEAAGAGHYGIDLGSLRLDAALLDGLDAADEVLKGWTAASERQPDGVAYWDLVAALNTPADMAGSVDSFRQAGRADLDGPLLNRRRDEFLASALREVL